MDVHTALICVGVFVVSAVVVYLISVLGIKEKTFEEAIEEQKRRSQETVVHTKTDKTKKDKKNFKKWSRRSKEKGSEKYQEEESQTKNISREHVEIKPEPEIIPESDTESKPPKNKKRKMNVLPKPILVKKEATLVGAVSEDKSNRSSDSESQDLKEEDKKLKNAYKEVVPEPVCVKKESPEPPAVEDFQVEKEISAKVVKTEQTAKETLPQSTNSAAVSKKKKTKQDQTESVVAGSTVTGSKLLTMLKDAVMTDEDVQMMIDFLLNKQGDISGWTKKNDPVTLLKKQLQDKEQAFEDEQSKSQANLTKLRELRKEFNQEKSRFSSIEQSLNDKINQHLQEIQTLQTSIKTTREQHKSELSSLQNKLQQLETKVNDKSKNIIKLQDENCRLEGIHSSLEVEKKKNSSEVSRLNSELKQLKDIKEQYQKKQADFDSLLKSRDEYQQKHHKLEEQLKQLTITHKKESENLQKQLSEAQQKLKTIETNNSAITQELNDAKVASSDVEKENSALQKRLQAVEIVVKDREEELKKLEASLEEASAQRNELESRLQQLQTKFEEFRKSQDERKQQGLMQVDNEHQIPVVGERTSAEGEEAPHHHQNGDLHLETSNKPVQKKMLELSEHERIVEEKEKALERLHDEVNEHKSTISTLSEELEQQKRKNNELREKNWKAMEAVSIAEKAAESKIEQLKKESSEQLIQCQKEAELRIEEARKTNSESRLIEQKTTQELKEAKEKAEENMREAEQRLHDESISRELRLSEVQGEFQQRLQSIQKSVDDRTTELNKAHEEYSLKIKEAEKREQELLQRIFPEIKIDQKLEHSLWITHYEQEATKLLGTLKSNVTINCNDSSRTELSELKSQLSLVIEERDKLDNQVQHYKTVLSETEGILNKLQNSVEAEEQVWRERLHSKEQELQKVMKSNEELTTEQKVLEASLLQLQGVEEMQAKLKELQAKLQGEESEKKVLEQKFDEASNRALILQEQLDSMLKELEDSKKDKEKLETLNKEVQQLKTQIDKERKITKDLSAQTVKLNSLVKIGQDALRAEQDTVKKLQAQLQSVKSSNLNGPPAESASIVESESETLLINSEKTKSKKRDVSGKK